MRVCVCVFGLIVVVVAVEMCHIVHKKCCETAVN